MRVIEQIFRSPIAQSQHVTTACNLPRKIHVLRLWCLNKKYVAIVCGEILDDDCRVAFYSLILITSRPSAQLKFN